MSNNMEIILCGVFVSVLWILARHIGYKEGFKDGYEQGEKDFKPRKGVASNELQEDDGRCEVPCAE